MKSIQSSNFENHFPEDRKKKLGATILARKSVQNNWPWTPPLTS